MTNEEAIRILKNTAFLVTSTSYQAIEEAVEVATKALTSATDINVVTKDGEVIYRQQAIDIIEDFPHGGVWNVESMEEMVYRIKQLPSAQPERTCVNCGRTVNNGGWYADGRTRCPIEEHYALPKDGYCHLWEKRNVTDDDYPERRTDKQTPLRRKEEGRAEGR